MIIISSLSLAKTLNSLDSVGIAGFSFDFGALDGKQAHVATAFNNFGTRAKNRMISPLMLLLAPTLPVLLKLPFGRTRVIQELKKDLTAIGTDLLDRVRREKEMGSALTAEKSIIGLLSKFGSQFEEAFNLSISQGRERRLGVAYDIRGDYSTDEHTLACRIYHYIDQSNMGTY